MSKLRTNIFFLVGQQGINYLVPLVILPYLVRVLGPSGYGVLGLSFTIIQYIVLFTDFGFNLSSSREIARNKDNIDYVNRVFSTTIYIKLFFSLLPTATLIFLIYGLGIFYEIRYVVFCGLVYVLGSVLTPIWLFQGLEKVVIFSVFTTVLKILTIPLIFLFVKSDSDADIAILIQGVIFLFTGVLSVFYAFKKFKISFVLVRLEYIKATIKDSGIIFIGTVAVSLYTLSTPIILGLMNDISEVGYFTAAARLRGAFIGIFLAMSGALYPRVTALFNEDKNKGFYFIKKLFIYVLPSLIISSLIFYIFAPEIAVIILGSEYDYATILMQIMAPVIVLVPSCVILANYLLLPLGEDKLFSRIPIFTVCCHFSYVFILSNYYGAIGASVAILMTECISLLTLIVINLRKGYLTQLWKS